MSSQTAVGWDIHRKCSQLSVVQRDEQQGHPDQLEVAVSTLMSHLQCYILALAAERVSRDTDIWVEPPTLANIFDEERAVQAKRRSAEGA